MANLRKCKICGDTVPVNGEDLCWCCEHTPKLHPTEPKPEPMKCSEDHCDIDFKNQKEDDPK